MTEIRVYVPSVCADLWVLVWVGKVPVVQTFLRSRCSALGNQTRKALALVFKLEWYSFQLAVGRLLSKNDGIRQPFGLLCDQFIHIYIYAHLHIFTYIIHEYTDHMYAYIFIIDGLCYTFVNFLFQPLIPFKKLKIKKNICIFLSLVPFTQFHARDRRWVRYKWSLVHKLTAS